MCRKSAVSHSASHGTTLALNNFSAWNSEESNHSTTLTSAFSEKTSSFDDFVSVRIYGWFVCLQNHDTT